MDDVTLMVASWALAYFSVIAIAFAKGSHDEKNLNPARARS